MNRKALLLGNTKGLPGVQIDLNNMYQFLLSNTGGAWYPDEILKYENISRSALDLLLLSYKQAKLDYFFIYFSGHGGYIRNTVLSLNSNNETINEYELVGFSERQLNIYDCCRYIEEEQKVAKSMDSMRAFSESSAYNYRLQYEKRIMAAKPQQVCLYACSVGEYANDTRNGGVYTQNLLLMAQKSSTQFKLVSTAHYEACNPTSLATNKTQNPDCLIPRLQDDDQLIISLHPQRLYY